VLPARVADTVHETPPRVAVKVVPERTQIPDVTDHETLPPDWPPDALTVTGEPVTNEAILVMKKPDCDARPIVIVVFEEFTAK
jgi:hypothetical protein